MAAGAWTFTHQARRDILDADMDVEDGTFLCALHLNSGTEPSTAATTWAGLSTSQHATANGYTAGGISVDLTLSAAGATITIDIATDPVWAASGGSILARWAVIYKSGGNVLCYCLLDATDADVEAVNGQTLTVAAHASGVGTLTQT